MDIPGFAAVAQRAQNFKPEPVPIDEVEAELVGGKRLPPPPAPPKPIVRPDRLLERSSEGYSGPAINQSGEVQTPNKILGLPDKNIYGKGFTAQDVPDKVGDLIRQVSGRTIKKGKK